MDEPGQPGRRRKRGQRLYHQDQETGIDPLKLQTPWLEGAPGFAREAPPEAPPLPLKFTCSKCGTKVHPDANRCSKCRRFLHPRRGGG